MAGGWQQHVEYNQETVLAYHAVYACVTLIANDIGKLRPKLIEKMDTGVWTEITSGAFSPVLRRPNPYQNHLQFKEWWVTSKLLHGNAYGLKVRDNRGVVIGIYILDPSRVKPLVTPSAEVYYEIQQDNLANVDGSVIVPAYEIIHDRMHCLFHPLVGISPIYACGIAASIGITIEGNQEKFFANSSTPGGVLTAPGSISPETAARLKEYWDVNYTGDNAGKVAVLGDGLTFEAMRMSAVDSQLLEQLRWTAEVVCACFHVPPFKVGLGPAPTYQNAEVLNQIYYSDCLQSLIEQFEACMDEGLGLDGVSRGVELDLDGLLRMDSATHVKTLTEGVSGGLLTPNEARKRLDLGPLVGGDTVYLQQQYYSLEALSERDSNDPFAKPPPPALPPPAEDDPDEDDDVREMIASVRQDIEGLRAVTASQQTAPVDLAALTEHIRTGLSIAA
jgi:HK97 family phage portal protein